jgi:DNA polymerase-3 subunit beta
MQRDLNSGVAAVVRAIPRSQNPLASQLLARTDGDSFVLVGTDGETVAITYKLPAAIATAGQITMEKARISNLISNLPNDEVTLESSESGNMAVIKCNRTKAEIAGFNPDEFLVTEFLGDISVKLPAQQFRLALNRTVVAAAQDDSRPVLTGVQFEFSPNQLRLGAADGFRLSVHSLETPGIDMTQTVIVPRNIVREVIRLIDELDVSSDTTVEMQLEDAPDGGTRVGFTVGPAQITASLVQGTFPSYEQLIPSDHEVSIQVSVPALMETIRRADGFARDSSNIVRFTATAGNAGEGGKLAIRAQADESGTYDDEIDATVVGGDSNIAFNIAYIRDILGVIDVDTINIEVTSSGNPGVIKALGDDRLIHVVMPMYVQW